MELEKKKYTAENTSEQEIEAIKQRIDYCDEDVILFKEMPVPTVFAQRLFLDRFNEILNPNQLFHLIIDLREASMKKSDAEHREILKQTFEYYKSQIVHCCIVTTPNIFVRLTAKIVMRNRVRSSSIHSRMEDALNKISEIRK